MQLCKSPEYPIKAARLTRISSMHELQHIVGDETLDVKILYVVRDPAGINQSLIKSKKSTELAPYCYQELLTIKWLDTQRFGWSLFYLFVHKNQLLTTIY